MATQELSANESQGNPSHFIDRETIYHKLFLLGTVVGLMADNDENFNENDKYAMQHILYGVAKEIYPEWESAWKWSTLAYSAPWKKAGILAGMKKSKLP